MHVNQRFCSQYAVRALLTALGPLIGAEQESGRAVSPGWADGANKEKIAAWKKKAEELVDEIDEVVQSGTVDEYLTLMRKASYSCCLAVRLLKARLQRLGLITSENDDEADIINDLLTKMQNQNLDFHITFRTLCNFSPTAFLNESKEDEASYRTRYIEKLTPAPTASSSKMPMQDQDALLQSGRKEIDSWLEKYAERVIREKDAWANRITDSSKDINDDAWLRERESCMRDYNPRFVLRQWVLEEVIKRCSADPYKGKRILAKVMEVSIAARCYILG